jgi:mono/diheme cytochrome c family protein
MSKDEKLAYMTDVVMPRMKAVFVAYDPHRFAKMSCAGCHGADGEKRGWVMSASDLLLEPTPWNSGSAAPGRAPSEFDAFMAKSVTPEMAKLMGREVGAPNQGGFGCFGCHTPER